MEVGQKDKRKIWNLTKFHTKQCLSEDMRSFLCLYILSRRFYHRNMLEAESISEAQTSSCTSSASFLRYGWTERFYDYSANNCDYDHSPWYVYSKAKLFVFQRLCSQVNMELQPETSAATGHRRHWGRDLNWSLIDPPPPAPRVQSWQFNNG